MSQQKQVASELDLTEVSSAGGRGEEDEDWQSS